MYFEPQKTRSNKASGPKVSFVEKFAYLIRVSEMQNKQTLGVYMYMYSYYNQTSHFKCLIKHSSCGVHSL